MKTLNSLFLLIAVAAFTSGCNSLGYQKAKDTSTSLRETAQSIDDTLPTLETVIDALDALSENTTQDIVAQYQTYRTEVSNFEKSVGVVNSRAKDMQLLGDVYFRNWEDEIAKIQNNDIQSKSRNRKIDVSKKFNTLSLSYLEADELLTPFLSNLSDIRTAIGTDLTQGGLRSVQGLLKRAQKDAERIRSSLTRLSSDFRDLGIELAPNGIAKS